VAKGIPALAGSSTGPFEHNRVAGRRPTALALPGKAATKASLEVLADERCRQREFSSPLRATEVSTDPIGFRGHRWRRADLGADHGHLGYPRSVQDRRRVPGT